MGLLRFNGPREPLRRVSLRGWGHDIRHTFIDQPWANMGQRALASRALMAFTATCIL
jgi:hypothetical protein